MSIKGIVGRSVPGHLAHVSRPGDMQLSKSQRRKNQEHSGMETSKRKSVCAVGVAAAAVGCRAAHRPVTV